MAKRDPRRIITADAFTVSPDLLGIALARPSRRLIAIAIDGLLIAILSKIGGRMLLALISGVILWRASARPTADTSSRRALVRNALRLASIIAIIIFSMAVYKYASRKIGTAATDMASSALADSTKIPKGAFTVDIGDEKVDLHTLGLGLRDLSILPAISQLSDADDSAAAAPHADSIAHWLQSKPDSSRRKVATALVQQFNGSAGGAALRVSLRPWLPVEQKESADSTTRALEHLKRENTTLKSRNDELEKKYESEKQGFTIGKLLKGLSDVLGFGFGWSALYFTTFTMLMRGQTPGKKLLGIRVIRLDGEHITGWMSFERFGGYAASAATGLLGFAQILWDRNRQGLHDKATETVVIREIGGVPVRPADYPSARK